MNSPFSLSHYHKPFRQLFGRLSLPSIFFSVLLISNLSDTCVISDFEGQGNSLIPILLLRSAFDVLHKERRKKICAIVASAASGLSLDFWCSLFWSCTRPFSMTLFVWSLPKPTRICSRKIQALVVPLWYVCCHAPEFQCTFLKWPVTSTYHIHLQRWEVKERVSQSKK